MKKKSRGFRITVIVTVIVLAVSFVSTICFGVALGTDAIRELVDGSNTLWGFVDEGFSKLEANNWELKEENLITTEHKTYAADFDTVTINAAAAQISVIPSSDESIHAEFSTYGKNSTTKNLFTLTQLDGVFTVTGGEQTSGSAYGAKLVLAIPESKIKTLEIRLQAGTAELRGLTLDSLDIDNKISEITIKDTSVERAVIQNKTGDTQLESTFVYTKALEVQTSMGDVRVPVPTDSSISVGYSVDIGEVDLSEMDLRGIGEAEAGTLVRQVQGTEEIKCTVAVHIGDVALYSVG